MNLEEWLAKGLKPCKNDCVDCFKICINYNPIEVQENENRLSEGDNRDAISTKEYK